MDKRTTLALLLMAALLMIYPAIFMREPTPEQKPAQKSETPAAPAPAPAAPAAGAAVSAPTSPLSPPRRRMRRRSRSATAVIETPLYRASIATTGGQIKAWDLHFRGEKPLVLPGTR